jgi:single-strand DNA-binding protein
MAKDLNKVQLTGRLGADPEMRFTPQGSAVTTFRVASNRTWKTTEGEQKEDTEWFSIVAWNKLAEICNQYLSKGSRVYIEGRSQTRSWEDTTSGQTRYKTEIIANDMIILDGRREGGYSAEPAEVDEWDAAPEPAAAAAPAPRRQPATQAVPAAAPAPAAAAPARASNGGGATSRPAGRSAPAAPAPAARPAARKPVTDEDDLPF